MKTCENCKYAPKWEISGDPDCESYGLCRFPGNIKYIGNPTIFIPTDYSKRFRNIYLSDAKIGAYNSNDECPKWEEA